MDNLGILRLVVRIPDSEEVSYPLELGTYSLGADPHCMIRLAGPHEKLHARLSVDTTGVKVDSTSSAADIFLDGKPVSGPTTLPVGAILRLGLYEIFLKELAPPLGTATRSLPENAAKVDKILLQLRRGLPGYDDLLELLKPLISPREAGHVEKAFRHDIHALGLALFFLVLLQLGGAFLLADNPTAADMLYDFGGAVFLVVALVLVSYYRVSIAGRLLMPLLCLLRQYGASTSDWYEVSGALLSAFWLGVAFAVGISLDFGASSEPKRGLLRLRRLSLLAAGMWTSWLTYEELAGGSGWWPIFSVTAGIVCAAWSWTLGPWFERRSRLGKSEILDEELARLIGIRLWSRGILSRILVLCLSVIPLLLLIHSYQIEERLKWPKSFESVIVTDRPEDRIWIWNKAGQDSPPLKLRNQELGLFPDERIWFWEQTGQLFQLDDLRDHEFYGFLWDGLSERDRAEIETLAEQVQDDPENEATYRELKCKLKPYRLQTGKQAQKILTSFARSPDDQHQSLYLLEEAKLQGEDGEAIFSARDQLESGFRQFAGYTQEEIRSRAASSSARRFLLIFCGFLGLLILWRRGGDSGLAFWLGLWMLGAATLGVYRYNLFFLQATAYELWHLALAKPAFNLLLSTLLALDAATFLSLVLFALFLPCAATWAWVCWPTDSKSRRQQRIPGLEISCYLPILIGKILIVTAAMNLLFWSLPLLAYDTGILSMEVAFLTAGVLFVGVAFGVGYQLQRNKDERLDRLDLITGFLFLALQALVLLTTPETSPQSAYLRVILYVLVFLFTASLLALVVKKKFLKLTPWNLISTAVLAFFFVRVLEEKYLSLIHVLSGWLHLPETGAEVFTVLSAMALVPSLHHWIEKLLIHLSFADIRWHRYLPSRYSHLQAIEHRVSRALELLFDTRDPRSLGQVRRALAACGVRDYAFFARRGKRTFESSVLRHTTELPDQIQVSKMLLKFLGRTRTPIDLAHLAFDRKLFFVQFEIERLVDRLIKRPKKKTSDSHCYLLPILLGNSVRGLLFLFDVQDKHERAIGVEPVAAGMRNLGVLTTQLRYRHSDPR